jgi:CTP:molybdopterin cytidylyltransferase MocA
LIPIEALREWHLGVLKYLKKEFPGLKMRNESRLNAQTKRWEFCTIVFPQDRKPFYSSGYFTVFQLDRQQDVVLSAMGDYPKILRKTIQEQIAS